MPPLSSLALALAALAIASGCSFVDGRADVPPPATPPPLKGSFEAAAPVVAGQATRYYVDDNGTIWDDRGRKEGTGS